MRLQRASLCVAAHTGHTGHTDRCAAAQRHVHCTFVLLCNRHLLHNSAFGEIDYITARGYRGWASTANGSYCSSSMTWLALEVTWSQWRHATRQRHVDCGWTEFALRGIFKIIRQTRTTDCVF